MLELLWLVPALPFLGFLVLLFFGSVIPRRAVGIVGSGAIGLSALIALWISYTFVYRPPADHAFTQVLWTWFDVAGFSSQIALRFDALSLVMTLVVTGVGFLIHVYSIGYMSDDEDYCRFFSGMNLFVAMMLILVLADDLLLLLSLIHI